jgi:hypothetical protein
MLIVSFCDIVTITTATLFFVLIITVQEAVKIPIFRPTPRAAITDKLPVFFECRGNEVFDIDYDDLKKETENLLSSINPSVRGGDLGEFLKVIQAKEIGNAYYKVNPNYLLTGIMALEPRPDVPGEGTNQLEKANSKYQAALAALDGKTQYVAFLVRDDSFNVFRKARELADKGGFSTGWELLGQDEPIKFGTTGSPVMAQ